MPKLTRANLADPAHQRPIGSGIGTMNPMGHIMVGRAQLPPGWRWSIDLKPIVGTESCMVHHLQVLLAGRLAVRMDDGEEAIFGPYDTFEIVAGHDTWVVGDEPVDILDISGNVEDFGLPSTTSRAVATLLLTDIVDSTANLARIGDVAWRQTLAATTGSCGASCGGRRAGRSRRPATDSLPSSPVPLRPSPPRFASATASQRLGSRRGSAFTPARSSVPATTSAGSPCTLPLG
jgi:hypothetical protein